MNTRLRTARLGALGIASAHTLSAAAQNAPTSAIERLKSNILSYTPETKVAKVDHQRLIVRKLDIVDENGVIRMTLAAPTPPPILDGIQYKRAFPVSGLTVFDKSGNERGGYGVADIEGTATIVAQDHVNGDAVGWRVMPDGSITFTMNQRGAVTREPALDNHIRPSNGVSRLRMNVAANGAPSIELTDKQERPRVRMTVTEEGYGAIEFLNAAGRIVETFAPEARRVQGDA